MPIKSRRKRIRKSKEFIRVKRTRITRRGNRRHHNGGNSDDGASNGNNFEQITKNAQTTISDFSNKVRETWSSLFSTKS
uniref:Uncharacterized protein n=1 Tax=viral metagenome TaxID=1070528 RepID=A0A6C0H3W6_9ZZZZ